MAATECLTKRRREEEGLGGAEKPYIDSKKGLGEPKNPKQMHGGRPSGTSAEADNDKYRPKPTSILGGPPVIRLASDITGDNALGRRCGRRKIGKQTYIFRLFSNETGR